MSGPSTGCRDRQRGVRNVNGVSVLVAYADDPGAPTTGAPRVVGEAVRSHPTGTVLLDHVPETDSQPSETFITFRPHHTVRTDADEPEHEPTPRRIDPTVHGSFLRPARPSRTNPVHPPVGAGPVPRTVRSTEV